MLAVGAAGEQAALILWMLFLIGIIITLPNHNEQLRVRLDAVCVTDASVSTRLSR